MSNSGKLSKHAVAYPYDGCYAAPVNRVLGEYKIDAKINSVQKIYICTL